MFFHQSRLIVAHAWPMLIAQLASMGMMVIDTVLLGHFGTEDLAAVAVGSGIYVAVILALSSVVQAVSPTVAHLKGEGRDGELAGVLHQGFWLALTLSVPGVLCLLHPDPLLGLSSLEPGVESKVRGYLAALAWGMPASLLYRAFYAFCVAVGQPRPLMAISLLCTLVHGLLASALVSGAWGGTPLGALGCGASNALIGWLALAAGLTYMRTSRRLRVYRLFHGWRPPRLEMQRALLRLGVPMGLSGFVEISAFTFIALFVAQLGTQVVAGHRVVANLAGICYMLPLSLALATLPCVGQAAGARDWRGARVSALAGRVRRRPRFHRVQRGLVVRPDGAGRRLHRRSGGARRGPVADRLSGGVSGVRRGADGRRARLARLQDHLPAHAGACRRLLGRRAVRRVVAGVPRAASDGRRGLLAGVAAEPCFRGGFPGLAAVAGGPRAAPLTGAPAGPENCFAGSGRGAASRVFQPN